MAWTRVVKEDGTLVTNSNSYINEADFDAYCTLIGFSLTAIADANQETAVIAAADYINSLPFLGYPVAGVGAVMQWPRGDTEFVDDEIPPVVLKAQSWLAVQLLTDSTLKLYNDTTGGEVRSVSVGEVSKSWFSPDERKKDGVRFDYIDNLLRAFLDDSIYGGSFVGEVFC